MDLGTGIRVSGYALMDFGTALETWARERGPWPSLAFVDTSPASIVLGPGDEDLGMGTKVLGPTSKDLGQEAE